MNIILGFTREDGRTAFYLFRMNLRDRYLGSRLGMLWSLINPLVLMGMFVVVFGFILKSRIPGSDRSIDFVIWLISGYATWMAVTEGLNNAASSVVSGASLLKNIVFKSELLPIAATLGGIFPLTVGLVLLIGLLLASGHGLSLNIFWLLIIIPLQFGFLIGVGFYLAAFTVFIRDITQILGSALTLLMFFTPLFYSIDQMPDIIQQITFYNPFYHIAESFRAVLVYKHPPSYGGLAYLTAVTVLLWFSGLKIFRRLKGYFDSCL